MGSLVREYPEEKLKGKIYTPEAIVNLMLDEIGFFGENVFGKKILDPACGDGRFLVEVVKRILRVVPKKVLPEALKNVYGWDIDPFAVSKCIDNLNALIKPYKISIDWNIQVKNSLNEIEKVKLTLFTSNSLLFDIIIGNPPYIRIQHLDPLQRVYIQHNYEFCKKGSTDVYIAFFEICFNLLKQDGIGVLITPNTYLHSQAGESLREFIKQNQNVKKIINFKWLQLFKNASTYSAITVFSRKAYNNFVYQEYYDRQKIVKKIIDYKSIKNYKVFNFRFEQDSLKGKKLKEICKIGVGVTTLNNKAYIFNDYKCIDENLCSVNTFYKGVITIEKAILKPIIKGSTFKGDNGHPKEWILFPYEKVDGKYKIIPEEELQCEYPLAYNYLVSIKDILGKRDNGKPNPVAWYAFGRNQSLDTAFGRKIIFSPLNSVPNFILSNLEDCTLYSGYYIKYDGDYQTLLQQLNSDRMHQYILSSSRDFRGGWKAYNKKILDEFIVYL